jgi:hypothetical protein
VPNRSRAGIGGAERTCESGESADATCAASESMRDDNAASAPTTSGPPLEAGAGASASAAASALLDEKRRMAALIRRPSPVGSPNDGPVAAFAVRCVAAAAAAQADTAERCTVFSVAAHSTG